MDMASDRPGDYSTGAGLEASPGQGALPGETTELVAVDGPRLLWRVRVWFGLGRRGRYHDYCVWTRTLPSGRIEVVGPRGRRRRVDPRAERWPLLVALALGPAMFLAGDILSGDILGGKL